MMGEGDRQAPMWSYRVNLDKRVRGDHPLRRINEVLDFLLIIGSSISLGIDDEFLQLFEPLKH
jgi:hypothetical protein